jgi:hypothetical protein
MLAGAALGWGVSTTLSDRPTGLEIAGGGLILASAAWLVRSESKVLAA